MHFVRDFQNDLEKLCLMSHPSSCKEECLLSMSQSPNLSLAFPAGKWEREEQRDEMISFHRSAQGTLSLIFTGVPMVKLCENLHA